MLPVLHRQLHGNLAVNGQLSECYAGTAPQDVPCCAVLSFMPCYTCLCLACGFVAFESSEWHDSFLVFHALLYFLVFKKVCRYAKAAALYAKAAASKSKAFSVTVLRCHSPTSGIDTFVKHLVFPLKCPLLRHSTGHYSV